MSDFTLDPQHTLIVGMTGSGKTTFVNRYLLNEPGVACQFIYDDLNRMWPRLLLPCRHTPEQMESSLATRRVAFNPSRILASFGGDPKAAFAWWCEWVFSVCQRGPGKKQVVVPEVWRHCSPNTIPMGLASIAQAGRELGIELVVDTQRPNALHSSITGAVTEVVAFKLMDPLALKALEGIFMSAGIDTAVEEVSALPPGRFISWNRLSGGRLSGQVF